MAAKRSPKLRGTWFLVQKFNVTQSGKMEALEKKAALTPRAPAVWVRNALSQISSSYLPQNAVVAAVDIRYWEGSSMLDVDYRSLALDGPA